MKMPALAGLLGCADESFRMETPSDFCAVCRQVENVNVPDSGIFPGEASAIEKELREARRPFPPGHFEVNQRLLAAIDYVKKLDMVGT